MASQCDVPDWDAVKTVCPLQCQLRYGAATHDPGDQASAGEHVDWAGLPINLDFAFSQAQRDKVHAQHLMRKRVAQLRRWLHDGAQLCVCEVAARDGNLESDSAQPMLSQ